VIVRGRMNDRQLAGEVAEGRHVVVTATLGARAPSGAAAPVSPRLAPSPAVYKPLRPNEQHPVMTDAIRAKRFDSA